MFNLIINPGDQTNKLDFLVKFTLLETNSNHGLTPKNLKKIMLIAKLTDILILRLMRTSCSGVFLVVHLGFSAMAYIKQEFTIYLISIIIWYLILWFWVLRMTAIIGFGYSILFFNIYYLTIRYKQLYDLGIKTHNLQQTLYEHTKLTMMTHQSNQLFKYWMVYNYFVCTFIALMAFIIFQYGNGIFLFRLACLFAGYCSILLILMMTLFSARLSLEAHRFYKSINFVAKLGLQMKLKVSIL